MELRQLEYFVAVAEARSFTTAAQRLGVGQPAASAAVRRLEDSLAVELFARTPAGVVLTAAGETLLPAARRTLDAARGARELVDGVRDGERGTVRFGNLELTYDARITDVLAGFRLRHPLVTAELMQGGIGCARLIEQVREARLDCAISATLGQAPPGVRFQTLFTSEYCLHVSEDHPRIRAERVAPGDLAQEPFVGAPAGTPERADLDHLLSTLGIDPPIPLEVNSFDATFALVREQQAVALLPRSLRWLHPPGVRTVTIDHELPRCRTVAVTPAYRPIAPVASELLDDVIEAWLARATAPGDASLAEAVLLDR